MASYVEESSIDFVELSDKCKILLLGINKSTDNRMELLRQIDSQFYKYRPSISHLFFFFYNVSWQRFVCMQT